MRKAIKAGLIVVALLLLGVIAFSITGYQLARGAPDWYRPHLLSAEELAQAARRADNKFLSLIDRAAGAQAAERRARDSTSTTARAADESPINVSFTSEELNAFFYKWIRLNHWDQKLGNYLSQPQLVLHDGHIILAGTIPWDGIFRGTVLSIRFLPRLTANGQLFLKIDGISAGRLPLPDVIWNSRRDELENLVRQKLPLFARQARISDSGSANSSAVAAAMGGSLLRILDDQPAEPVLFLPLDSRHGYPVRLTGVEVQEGSITFSALPLTGPQRADLLARIKSAGGDGL